MEYPFSDNEGRVEMCVEGRWTTVCSNSGEDTIWLAGAACSQLGFSVAGLHMHYAHNIKFIKLSINDKCSQHKLYSIPIFWSTNKNDISLFQQYLRKSFGATNLLQTTHVTLHQTRFKHTAS